MRILGYLLAASIAVSTAAYAGAIHDAAKTGDVDAIKAELKAGVDVNVLEEKGLKATALYYAVSRGQRQAAALLIDRGADVNRAADLVGPPLITAAAKGRVDLLQLLLAHGADPNGAFQGTTALHEAAAIGCFPCVKKLVTVGADVNAINARREPAIHLALFNRHPEIAGFLATHGYVKPVIPAISGALSMADPLAGQRLFAQKCDWCHDGTAAEAVNRGPPLWDIVGRPRAAVPHFTFSYSKAMQAEGGIWGFEELNRFLAEPTRIIPGTSMKSVSIEDAQDRANLIVYLRTLSDSPVPVPQY